MFSFYSPYHTFNRLEYLKWHWLSVGCANYNDYLVFHDVITSIEYHQSSSSNNVRLRSSWLSGRISFSPFAHEGKKATAYRQLFMWYLIIKSELELILLLITPVSQRENSQGIWPLYTFSDSLITWFFFRYLSSNGITSLPEGLFTKMIRLQELCVIAYSP